MKTNRNSNKTDKKLRMALAASVVSLVISGHMVTSAYRYSAAADAADASAHYRAMAAAPVQPAKPAVMETAPAPQSCTVAKQPNQA